MIPIVVYVTAKREHAPVLEKLSYEGIHFNARWMFMRHRGNRPVTHWLRENFADAVSAHFVVLYVEPGDKLKTSLIEVGHAMAHDKTILIAGDRQAASKVMEGLAELSGKDPEAMFANDWIKNLPHRDIDPWCGFTGVKVTGTMDQTVEYIRSLQRTKVLFNHRGERHDT